MLEKLIKDIGRKITLTVLAGTLLFGSGCGFYKVMSPISIKPVKSIEKTVEKIDYSKLTWREAIRHVQTPEQAQDYLKRHFDYDCNESAFALPGLFSMGGKGETFKHNHIRRKGVCFDYATVAAALLSDDGYPPLLLDLQDGPSSDGHSLFLYRTDTGFGALGTTPMKPIYSSTNELVKNINTKYEEHYTQYNVINLDENVPCRQWIGGDMDLRPPIDIFGKFNSVE